MSTDDSADGDPLPVKLNFSKLVVLAMLAVIVLEGLAYVALRRVVPSLDDAASVGDSFGPVAVLFSGIATALFVAALWFQLRSLELQRRELKLQREELTLTRSELHQQAAHLGNQVQTLQRQGLENTFFHLLELHLQGTRSAVVCDGTARRIGLEAFEALVHDFYLRQQNVMKTERLGVPDAMHKAYVGVYDCHRQELGRYFRSLKMLLAIADRLGNGGNSLPGAIIRAQLSDREQALVLLECVFRSDTGDFAMLVEKHGILRGVSDRHFPGGGVLDVIRSIDAPRLARLIAEGEGSEPA